jgi:hypothetical protein
MSIHVQLMVMEYLINECSCAAYGDSDTSKYMHHHKLYMNTHSDTTTVNVRESYCLPECPAEACCYVVGWPTPL